MKLQQLKTLKENLLKKNFLGSLFLIFSVSLILFSAYLSDYISEKFNLNSWVVGINIYRFAFLALIFSVKKEIIKLISVNGYRVIFYLLVNHFIDICLNYTTWSENDTITVIMIVVEAIILYLKKKKPITT